jgi:hypothetical protein
VSEVGILFDMPSHSVPRGGDRRRKGKLGHWPAMMIPTLDPFRRMADSSGSGQSSFQGQPLKEKFYGLEYRRFLCHQPPFCNKSIRSKRANTAAAVAQRVAKRALNPSTIVGCESTASRSADAEICAIIAACTVPIISPASAARTVQPRIL